MEKKLKYYFIFYLFQGLVLYCLYILYKKTPGYLSYTESLSLPQGIMFGAIIIAYFSLFFPKKIHISIFIFCVSVTLCLAVIDWVKFIILMKNYSVS